MLRQKVELGARNMKNKKATASITWTFDKLEIWFITFVVITSDVTKKELALLFVCPYSWSHFND